jgi:hypothetical protein
VPASLRSLGHPAGLPSPLAWAFSVGLGGCAARTVVLIVGCSFPLGLLAGWLGASRRGVGRKGLLLVSRHGVCPFCFTWPWARLPPALSLPVRLLVVGPLTCCFAAGLLMGWPACKDEGFALEPDFVRPDG